MANNQKRIEYTFTWFIENYSYCLQKTGEALHSPEFCIQGLEKTVWRVGLHPRGENDKNKGCVSLFLKRSKIDCGPEDISLRYELSLLSVGGSKDLSKEFQYTFQKGYAYGCVSFIEMPELFLQKRDTFLPNDTLGVRCKIRFGDGDIYKEVKCFARTIIATERVAFLHVFRRFSTLKPSVNRIFKFRLSNEEGALKTKLKLDYGSSCDGILAVEIASTNTSKIISACGVYLVGATGGLTKCGGEDNRHDHARRDIRRLLLTRTKKAILDRKEEFLRDDKLILLYLCDLSTGVKYENIEKTIEDLRRS